MTSPHQWADRSEHEKRCSGCHTTAVRIFRPDGEYDLQYFAPDFTQIAVPPDCTAPSAGRSANPMSPAPFYVFAPLGAPLAETQAAALRRELAASGARSWHVNSSPAFVSVRLNAGTMPGAQAAARPVVTGVFERAGLAEHAPGQLIAIPEGQSAPCPSAGREPAPAVTQPRLLEAG